MKEKEISLIDLLTEVLLHWRMIIICMLAGGVVFGAVSGRVSDKEKTIDVASPEQYLSEQEIQNVKWVAAYEKAYREAGEYIEKSVMMKMDPNQVGRVEATIAIEAEDRQKSCDIEKVYEDIVRSGGLKERVAEDADIEIIGIEEMILLGRDGTENNNNNIMINESEGKNTFRIIVKYADKDQAKKMLESAIVFLKEKQPDIESVLGKHEIAIANESFAIVVDTKIAKTQRDILNNAAYMKESLSDAKKELSDLEQQYYAFLMSDQEAGQTGAAQTAATSTINVKNAFIGAVLAAFLYAFLIFLVYILDTKIRATDSLQELYGIPQLGMIPAVKTGKKPFYFIDRWILSFRDRNKRKFTPEEALELASASIKISAGKEGFQELCLISCGLKERPLEMSERIKAYLEKDGIQVKILNNVLYDAQMMEELEHAKGVVLAESIGITLYSEIEKELEFLQRQKITVLGGILLE